MSFNHFGYIGSNGGVEGPMGPQGIQGPTGPAGTSGGGGASFAGAYYSSCITNPDIYLAIDTGGSLTPSQISPWSSVYDTNGYMTDNSSCIMTIPTTGFYRVECRGYVLYYDGSDTAKGSLGIQLVINGQPSSKYFTQQAIASYSTSPEAEGFEYMPIVPLNAGDTISFILWNNANMTMYIQFNYGGLAPEVWFGCSLIH